MPNPKANPKKSAIIPKISGSCPVPTPNDVAVEWKKGFNLDGVDSIIMTNDDNAFFFRFKADNSVDVDDDIVTVSAGVPIQTQSQSSAIEVQTKSDSSAVNKISSVIREKAKRALDKVKEENRTPKPEYSRRMREEEKEINDSLTALTNSVQTVAKTLSLRAYNTQQGSSVSQTDTSFSAINYALKLVPETKKVPCLIDLLKVADAYKNGYKVVVSIEEE